MSSEDPIDLSLRLWSDDIPFSPFIERMGVNATHLYRRGEPINAPILRSPRISDKHYASIARARCRDDAGVSAWLDDILRRLDSEPALVDLMRSGQVEVLLWIATLGHRPAPPPVRVDPAHVEAASRLGAKIFLEDYNRFDDGGVPQKTWLN